MGAAAGLLIFGWLILLSAFIAYLETKKSGFFIQSRVGMNGRLFKCIKIRTMIPKDSISTSVTTTNDPRITRCGRFFRKYKVDELPQLINILKGDMSFVGPRPDVPGYADKLKGAETVILSLRPGITGPATIKYADEESVLANTEDPEAFNAGVIWPDKVLLNSEYVRTWSFKKDIRYLIETVFKI